MLVWKYVEEQLDCHAGYQEVSRGLHQRWIWGFCCTQVMKNAGEGIHPGFETQGTHYQKSKKGYQWPHRKGLMSSKKVKEFHQLLTLTRHNCPILQRSIHQLIRLVEINCGASARICEQWKKRVMPSLLWNLEHFFLTRTKIKLHYN